jgi:LemA protein
MLAAIIVIVVIVLLIVFLSGLYNGMVRARNKVDEAWAGSNVLKRRHDLIRACGVGQGTRRTGGDVQAVTDARTKAMSANAGLRTGAAEGALSQALGGCCGGGHPQLRATENFQRLRDELTNTEDQIAPRGARTTATYRRTTPRIRYSRTRSSRHGWVHEAGLLMRTRATASRSSTSRPRPRWLPRRRLPTRRPRLPADAPAADPPPAEGPDVCSCWCSERAASAG